MDDKQDISLHSYSNLAVIKLHDDVLWHIFTFNAESIAYINDIEPYTDTYEELFELHPLNIARSTSQVCRQWRQVILGTSSIWANLIDLDFFNKDGIDYWMHEVMRRTGQSLLSVVGGRDPDREVGDYGASHRLLVSLLSEHWFRIRKFNVITNPFDFDLTLWGVFWEKPAPNLEEFGVYPPRELGPFPYIPPGRTLFSNNAPLLRTLHHTELGFNYRASWIRQLTSLNLSDRLSVQEALELLSQIKGLQTFIFKTYRIMPHPVPPGLCVTLPDLQIVQVIAPLETCTALLKHITPATTYHLRLRVLGRYSNDESDASFEGLRPLLSRFLEAYFGATNTTDSDLELGDGWFTFSLPCRTAYRVTFYPRFRIDIGNPFALPLAKLFRASHLQTITEVRMIDCVTEDTDTKTDPDRDAFFLSLTSVKTLQVSQDGLELINKISPQNTLIFPSLSKVKLRYPRKSPRELQNTTPLLIFLARRKQAGARVAVLDISEWPTTPWTDWGYLDFQDGLKVIWNANGKDEQYTCGSGQRERLRIGTM